MSNKITIGMLSINTFDQDRRNPLPKVPRLRQLSFGFNVPRTFSISLRTSATCVELRLERASDEVTGTCDRTHASVVINSSPSSPTSPAAMSRRALSCRFAFCV